MFIPVNDYDLLEDGCKSQFVSVLVLEGNNGSKSHAMATVQNLIFDSNCDCAMNLNKENLDWCVSSDDVDCRFVGVHWGLILFHSHPPTNLGSGISKGEHHSVILVLFVWSLWMQ